MGVASGTSWAIAGATTLVAAVTFTACEGATAAAAAAAVAASRVRHHRCVQRRC